MKEIMKKFSKLLALFLMTLFLMNCAGKKPETYEDSNVYFRKAQISYEKEKWLKAIDNFRLYILNNPGGELADDAQFYLGECYFNREEYLLAIAEYTQLVERYKYSELLVDGYYKIALAYYELSPKYQRDQVNTDKALRQLQEFIDAYPNTENAKKATEKIGELRNKLAKKMYKSAQIYRKISQWDASILYADDMLNQYYDSEYVVYAKFEKAYCYIKKREFDSYEKIKSEIETDKTVDVTEKSKLSQRLERLYNKEKRKIEREKRKERNKERRRNWWF